MNPSVQRPSVWILYAGYMYMYIQHPSNLSCMYDPCIYVLCLCLCVCVCLSVCVRALARARL